MSGTADNNALKVLLLIILIWGLVILLPGVLLGSEERPAGFNVKRDAQPHYQGSDPDLSGIPVWLGRP